MDIVGEYIALSQSTIACCAQFIESFYIMCFAYLDGHVAIVFGKVAGINHAAHAFVVGTVGVLGAPRNSSIHFL